MIILGVVVENPALYFNCQCWLHCNVGNKLLHNLFLSVWIECTVLKFDVQQVFLLLCCQENKKQLQHLKKQTWFYFHGGMEDSVISMRQYGISSYSHIVLLCQCNATHDTGQTTSFFLRWVWKMWHVKSMVSWTACTKYLLSRVTPSSERC